MNLKGPFLTCREFRPAMMEAHWIRHDEEALERWAGTIPARRTDGGVTA